jgi:hypothetical protein
MTPHETPPSSRGLSTTLAVLAALLIFAALVWVTRHYTVPSTAADEARKRERAAALAELRAVEADAMTSTAWVNQEKGIVRMPIADAMKLAERMWQNPTEARATMIARAEKAAELPPPPPAEPNPFE